MIKKLPDAELTIMLIIWQAGGNVNSAYIQKHLLGDKEWKLTSILTFLSRLVEKGFLSCQKEQRNNIYAPLISQKEYLAQESKSFLKKLYGNSFTSLVSNLYDSKAIDKDDLAELQLFINEK
ncbi:MAG: BlaI/MecI/CopY family transcriptional regulator, partial [Clostridiales bacterium]